ncbi:18888_t:CDS:2, partial [Funneliformis geosporum]
QSLSVSILAGVVRARKAVSQLAFAKIVFLSCPLMVWSGCCKAIQRALTATTAVSLVTLRNNSTNIESIENDYFSSLFGFDNNDYHNEDELEDYLQKPIVLPKTDPLK